MLDKATFLCVEEIMKRHQSLKEWIRKEREETQILLRCIPATTVSLFVVSVIIILVVVVVIGIIYTMNHFKGKSGCCGGGNTYILKKN